MFRVHVGGELARTRSSTVPDLRNDCLYANVRCIDCKGYSLHREPCPSGDAAVWRLMPFGQPRLSGVGLPSGRCVLTAFALSF